MNIKKELYHVGVVIVLIWIRTGTSGGCCENGNGSCISQVPRNFFSEIIILHGVL
jgi:hypothetical protein